MKKTIISALVRRPMVQEAIDEARLGIEDGAKAVMFDMSDFSAESCTIDLFREIMSAISVPAHFCKYEFSDPTRLPPVDGPMLVAAEAGAEYVDVSAAAVPAAHRFGAKVFVSEHILDRSVGFDEAMKIFSAQRAAGADIVKLVARMDTAAEFDEAKRVMAYLRDHFDHPWIYLGLGTHGFEQRFLGPEYGCAMEFARHAYLTPNRDQPLIRDFCR